MLKDLLCSDTIYNVVDKSDPKNGMHRARVNFKNGYWLSIITGDCSYGGDKGLFEIMPSDESILDDADKGDSVVGDLTVERVKYYINKIGMLDANPPAHSV